MGCNETFAIRIKALRESRGLTTRQLGAALGIGNNTISQYENCKRTPDINMVKLFADYFNVSCDYLAGMSNNPERLR
jgi:transcriptional regulator with XRE-family HTH domain